MTSSETEVIEPPKWKKVECPFCLSGIFLIRRIDHRGFYFVEQCFDDHGILEHECVEYAQWGPRLGYPTPEEIAAKREAEKERQAASRRQVSGSARIQS